MTPNMQHAPLPSIPNCLLACMSSLNDDELIPVSVPAFTFAFIARLGRQCDHSTKPLAQFFLTANSLGNLREAVLATVASSDFHAVRDELQRWQREKEEAVANEAWQRAAACRDKTEELKSRLRQMAKEPTELLPEHVLQAIARLGFTEQITV